jgi:hypothetical protein
MVVTTGLGVLDTFRKSIRTGNWLAVIDACRLKLLNKALVEGTGAFVSSAESMRRAMCPFGSTYFSGLSLA